eukprot:TRINITY_DN14137_c0_g1_i2.p1 TRINITY_DN14137_c0_g1~~TRINITY_DN14137_c0_g1_i2.p1  ORF type:complete len:1052 (+),score=305.24 TRINITY_DN14137_c0_g1_i2:80-3157(+)
MPVVHVVVHDASLLGSEGRLAFACWLAPQAPVAVILDEAVRRTGAACRGLAALDIGELQLTVEPAAGCSAPAPLRAALADSVERAGLASGDVVHLDRPRRSPPRPGGAAGEVSPPPSPPPTPPPLPPRAPTSGRRRGAPSAESARRRGRTAPAGRGRRRDPRGAATVTLRVLQGDDGFCPVRFVVAIARRLEMDPAEVEVVSISSDDKDQFGFATGPAPRGQRNRRFEFPDPKYDKPRFSSTPKYCTRMSPFSHQLRRSVVVLRLGAGQAEQLLSLCANPADPFHAAVPGVVQWESDLQSPRPQRPSPAESRGTAAPQPSTAARPRSRRRRPSGYYNFVRAEVKLLIWQKNPQTRPVAAEARCQWKTYFLFPALDADTTAPWAMSSELQRSRRLREFLRPRKEKLFEAWCLPVPHCWEEWTGQASPKRDGGPLLRSPTPPMVRHAPQWLCTDDPRADERNMQLQIHASWQCVKAKPRGGCGRWNTLRAAKCYCDRPRPKEVTEYAKARMKEEEFGGPEGGRKPWKSLLTGEPDTAERFAAGETAEVHAASASRIGIPELTAKWGTPPEWNLKETMKRLNGRKLAADYIEFRDRMLRSEERRRERLVRAQVAHAATCAAAQRDWEQVEGRYRELLAERGALERAELRQRRVVALEEECCGVALGRILRLWDMETAWRLALWLHWEEFTPREWIKWLGFILMGQEESEKRPRIRQEEDEAWQKIIARHEGRDDGSAEKKVWQRLVPEPAAGKKCCIVPPTAPEKGPQPGVISEITPASVRVEFVDKRELGRQDIKFEWYEEERKKFLEEEAAREKGGVGDDDLDEDAKLAKRDARRIARMKRERALMLALEILPMVPYWKGWTFVGLQDDAGNIIADRAVRGFGKDEISIRALRHELVRDTKREKQSDKVLSTYGAIIHEDPTVQQRFKEIEEAVRAHARKLNQWRELGAPPQPEPEPAADPEDGSESDASHPVSPHRRSRAPPASAGRRAPPAAAAATRGTQRRDSRGAASASLRQRSLSRRPAAA